MSNLRGFFLLPLGFLALIQGSGPGQVAQAQAQDALSTCTLAGTPLLNRGLQLYEAPREEKPLVEFIGASAPLAVVIPEDPVAQRAKATVHSGKPGLRVEGWISLENIPVYAVKDVEVVGSQVQLAGGHRVKLTRGSKGKLNAELTIAGSQGQQLRGSGDCSAFSLAWARPSPEEPPAHARTALMKGTELELFDKPGGENIFTLFMSEGASPLFYTVEHRGMFQRVVSRSDVVINAWVKVGSLTPIRKEDRIETPPSAPSQGPGARMVLESPPPLKTAPKEIPVRSQRDEKSKPIGVLEKGAEVYVMQIASGWANVLPKELNFSPAGGGGFWVPLDELPR
jgi:hypothetical protein